MRNLEAKLAKYLSLFADVIEMETPQSFINNVCEQLFNGNITAVEVDALTIRCIITQLRKLIRNQEKEVRGISDDELDAWVLARNGGTLYKGEPIVINPIMPLYPMPIDLWCGRLGKTRTN